MLLYLFIICSLQVLVDKDKNLFPKQGQIKQKLTAGFFQYPGQFLTKVAVVQDSRSIGVFRGWMS